MHCRIRHVVALWRYGAPFGLVLLAVASCAVIPLQALVPQKRVALTITPGGDQPAKSVFEIFVQSYIMKSPSLGSNSVSKDVIALRGIGKALADYVNVHMGTDDYSAAKIQAVAADLIGESFDLLIPIKDLLGRASFINIVLLAATGRGDAQKAALLKELANIYSTETLCELNEVLNGFLGLEALSMPSSFAPHGQSSAVNKAVKQNGKRTNMVWSILPVDNETWYCQIPASASSGSAPMYLRRRATAIPFNVARLIFFFPPLSVIIGWRQRSLALAVVPIASALLIGVFFEFMALVIPLVGASGLLNSFTAAIISCNFAHRIAISNRGEARKLLVDIY